MGYWGLIGRAERFMALLRISLLTHEPWPLPFFITTLHTWPLVFLWLNNASRVRERYFPQEPNLKGRS